MSPNELVMEVKPINARADGVNKDLRTLTAYHRTNYHRAILLVYGGCQNEFDRFRLTVKSIAMQDTDRAIDLQLIELWYHGICGQEATKAEW
jgi:hypothetical protein